MEHSDIHEPWIKCLTLLQTSADKDTERSERQRFFIMTWILVYTHVRTQNLRKREEFLFTTCDSDIFLHVGDISIDHQYHNISKCNVGDKYLMLVPWLVTNILNLSLGFQHPPPTSMLPWILLRTSILIENTYSEIILSSHFSQAEYKWVS